MTKTQDKNILNNTYNAIFIPVHTFTGASRYIKLLGISQAFINSVPTLGDKIYEKCKKNKEFPLKIGKINNTEVWIYQNKPAKVHVDEKKDNIIKQFKDKYKIGFDVPGYTSIPNIELISKNFEKIKEITSQNAWNQVALIHPDENNEIWDEEKQNTIEKILNKDSFIIIN